MQTREPQLDDELRAKLEQQFKEHQAKLAEQVGFLDQLNLTIQCFLFCYDYEFSSLVLRIIVIYILYRNIFMFFCFYKCLFYCLLVVFI